MSHKWAVMGVAAVGIVGAAAIGGTFLYLTSKEDEDFKNRNKAPHISSKQIHM